MQINVSYANPLSLLDFMAKMYGTGYRLWQLTANNNGGNNLNDEFCFHALKYKKMFVFCQAKQPIFCRNTFKIWF